MENVKIFRYFFTFLTFFNLLVVMNLVGSLIYLISKHSEVVDPDDDIIAKEYMSLVEIILSFLVWIKFVNIRLWFLLLLFMFFTLFILFRI